MLISKFTFECIEHKKGNHYSSLPSIISERFFRLFSMNMIHWINWKTVWNDFNGFFSVEMGRFTLHLVNFLMPICRNLFEMWLLQNISQLKNITSITKIIINSKVLANKLGNHFPDYANFARLLFDTVFALQVKTIKRPFSSRNNGCIFIVGPSIEDITQKSLKIEDILI